MSRKKGKFSKRSSLSKASNYDEIGEFWDAHKTMDYQDQTKEVEFEIDLISDINYFSIAKSLSDQLRLIAQKEGVSPNTLLNLWIQEKLRDQES